jgi:nitrite reductase/ring-hydroxylating ferredoxin subunit
VTWIRETTSEHLVAESSDFDEGDRVIIEVNGTEIGVFRHGDGFVAYENRCLHQGGPACEGVLIGKVEAVMAEDKTISGERFSETQIHFVCPWHGWEYDLSTGEAVADRRLKLRRFDVVERDNQVYVVA